MKRLAIWLAATVSALLVRAETYNDVVYSTEGDIVPGELTCQFQKAKDYADKNNIPLVVVWANPGCGFCGSFERLCLAKKAVTDWLKSRGYVAVFCLGQNTTDGSKAWTYTLSTAYPMCRVHWKKNKAGNAVDYKFVGRSGQMHTSVSYAKGLDVQFMETVDLLCGDYAGAEVAPVKPSEPEKPVTPVQPENPVTPSPDPNAKYKLTVTASGDGKVSGGGNYKAGKTAYLSASAKSGSVFSGWYSGSTLLSQAKSFAYKTTDADVSIVGKFILKSEDAVEVTCPLASQYTKGVAIDPVTVTVRGNSLPSVSVSGLPSGLSYRNGAISGKPSRSGVYTTTVTGKTSGGAKVVKTYTIVVSAFGEYYVKAPCDSTVGTVSGQGVYAAGKTVTLRMSVKRGNVFTGWYDGSTLLSTDKSYKFKMPSGDLNLTPHFITVEEDLAAVSLVVDDFSLDASTVLEKSAICGVNLSWDLISGGLSATKVAFSNLPSGLKYNATTRKLEGAPTTAKRYATKVKVQTAGGNVKTFNVAFTVEPLPKWVSGNYYGGCTYEGKVGRVKLTVSSAGKVSGKLIAAGTTHSFSANALDSFENGVFTLKPTIPYSYKEGKKTVKAVKTLALKLVESGDLGRISGSDSNGLDLEVLQNVWERKDLKVQVFTSGNKVPLVEFPNGLKIKIGQKGAVKIGGKIGSVSVSGDSQLVAGYENGQLTGEAEAVLSVSKSSLPGGYFGTELNLSIADRDQDGKIESVSSN